MMKCIKKPNFFFSLINLFLNFNLLLILKTLVQLVLKLVTPLSLFYIKAENYEGQGLTYKLGLRLHH